MNDSQTSLRLDAVAWLRRNGFELTVEFGSAATYVSRSGGLMVKIAESADEVRLEVWAAQQAATAPLRETTEPTLEWLDRNIPSTHRMLP